MSLTKIHVYFIPGMAAGEEIFRNINLPNDRFEVHILTWLIPNKKETMSDYCGRMAARVTENNPVLIGVSFGGVIAQEMSGLLELRKLIIISSVKIRKELPKRIKFAKKTLLYRLIPTRFVLSAEDLSKFAMGPKTEKRLRIYQQYLNVRDKNYLDWAIKQMVCWSRKKVVPNVIHLHGDKDVVFPIRNISNCILVEGGSHVMIINKGKYISNKIVEITLKD